MNNTEAVTVMQDFLRIAIALQEAEKEKREFGKTTEKIQTEYLQKFYLAFDNHHKNAGERITEPKDIEHATETIEFDYFLEESFNEISKRERKIEEQIASLRKLIK